MNQFGKILRSFCAAYALISIVGCSSDKEEATPDVSKIEVKLNTIRFDKEYFAIDSNHLVDGLKQLKAKYPSFTDFYLDTVLGLGVLGNYTDTATSISKGVRESITYKDYVNLKDSVNFYFPDTKSIDGELTMGFKYLKSYLPEIKVPSVYYINGLLRLSGFPAVIVDSATSFLSLDMFLGPQFPFYRSVGVPDYLGTHLKKSYIPIEYFSAVYERMNPFQQSERSLLDLMIQRGKKMYFLHKIMPQMTDSMLFGFTGRQISWCEKNEGNLFNFLVQKNLIYNKEERIVMPFVVDGPFAKGIGSAEDGQGVTPGNFGSWIGYKMVINYIKTHPKTTLRELIFLREEPSMFLSQAKYKPKA